MTFPAFREDGWLPAGHHTATWEEIILTFGGETGIRRAEVLADLLRWRDAARAKGMDGLLILDGSFASRKETSGDFGLVFIYDEATQTLIGSDDKALALTDWQSCRLQFGGDAFAFSVLIQRLSSMLAGTHMFDFDRQRIPKGVGEVRL